jgi:hypothetical protein
MAIGSASSYGQFDLLFAPRQKSFSPSACDIILKDFMTLLDSRYVLAMPRPIEVSELVGRSVRVRSANASIVRVSFEVVAKAPDEGLVRDAEDLTRRGKVNSAIDLIYSHVDRLMKQDRLVELDRILATVMVEQTSLDTLISLLTVTLPVRTKLPSRRQFYGSVERFARESSEWDETLLIGLGN